METMFYVTRQTTTNGTATDVGKATGRDKEEATLNAKIKAYKIMESFKNEASMISAFIGVTDLVNPNFIVSENWEKVIEPQKTITTEDVVAKLIADGVITQKAIDDAKASLEEKAE